MDIRGARLAHPYGVMPTGNHFLASPEEISVRSFGLGDMKCLPDAPLLDILFFLPPLDVISMLRVSRCLYVYCHYNDIWRDNYLRLWWEMETAKCNDKGDRQQPQESVKFRYTWKDSFAYAYCSYKKKMLHSVKIGACDITDTFNVVPHKPLVVRGIFSDLLYKPWACHTFDLEKSCKGFMDFDDIPRRSYDSLSIEEFVDTFEKQNKPLIITNATNEWTSMRKWDRNYLIEVCGTKLFRATSATAPLAASFTMKEYFNYIDQANEESPLYLFERDFASVTTLQDGYEVPKYFSPSSTITSMEGIEFATDLFRLFGEKRRPDYRWMITGPARSGSIFHIDPNQTNAWNACIQGRKKWIFYPPNASPPGVLSSLDGSDVTVPLSTGEWLLSFWKDHLRARKNEDVSLRPIETILLPGELIFVPHGYWHMVINLDLSIALTHNYVSTSNLADCLRFLRDKVDQISGVRDRADEDAVQPEEMFDSFCQLLQSEKIVSQTKIMCALNESLEENVKVGDRKGSDRNINIALAAAARRRKGKEEETSKEVPKETFKFSFDYCNE